MIRHALLITLALVALPGLVPGGPSDILFADFEGADYGWKATGMAFGKGPAKGTLPRQMPVTGFKGKGLVNSFVDGDGTTGTLTSPEFKIERKFINFLIGGGGFEGKTCMNLVVDGKVVRTATGPNTQPGGSEELGPGGWDVGDLAGKTARFVIVDDATGGWGHINVDHIVFSDQKAKGLLARASRELTIEHGYLHFPVKNGAKHRRVSVSVDGQIVREFTIELADAAPDWWAPLDVSAWKGKKLVVAVDKLADDSQALVNLSQDAGLKASENLYREALRPQLHFSARRGWLNDPNGLVYANGEYHLFFQHNPYGTPWGNMHWGHAVSKDLVHWQELPIALYPKRFNDWAFSGSAVVDKDNTSGWKKGDKDLIVAAFTSTGRGECIVYSNDNGRTWTEYEGNPVVNHAGRDPRLLWHADSKQWVMAVFDEQAKKNWISFYTSPDLKKWTYQSHIEPFYECPDLFELPVDGDQSKRKWILTAANSDYQVGTFDGKKFTPETKMLKGSLGKAFYAAQTFSHVPLSPRASPPVDARGWGRVIQIGWLKANSPGMSFNQCMSLPLELRLKTTADGPRLTWRPVEELSRLQGKADRVPVEILKPGDANPLAGKRGELLRIDAEFAADQGEAVTFTLGDVPITFHPADKSIKVKGTRYPAPLASGKQTVTIITDRTCIEIFANDGRAYLPVAIIPKAGDGAAIVSVSAPVRFSRLEVTELESMWKKAP